MHQRNQTQCTDAERQDYMRRAQQFYENQLTVSKDWQTALTQSPVPQAVRDDVLDMINCVGMYTLAEYLASLDGKTVRDWTKEY